MARTTENVCLTLRHKTRRALDAAAQSQRRSRSQLADMMLEGALMEADPLRQPQAVADSAESRKR